MTDGIIPALFDSFERRMLEGNHGQLDFMTRGQLKQLQQELIETIKQVSVDRKIELKQIGYCLRQDEVDVFEKILIGDNQE